MQPIDFAKFILERLFNSQLFHSGIKLSGVVRIKNLSRNMNNAVSPGVEFTVENDCLWKYFVHMSYGNVDSRLPPKYI